MTTEQYIAQMTREELVVAAWELLDKIEYQLLEWIKVAKAGITPDGDG